MRSRNPGSARPETPRENRERQGIVDDDCNDLMNPWFLCPEWLKLYPILDDPNGDGKFSILDYLYLNLSDPNP